MGVIYLGNKNYPIVTKTRGEYVAFVLHKSIVTSTDDIKNYALLNSSIINKLGINLSPNHYQLFLNSESNPFLPKSRYTYNKAIAQSVDSTGNKTW